MYQAPVVTETSEGCNLEVSPGVEESEKVVGRDDKDDQEMVDTAEVKVKDKVKDKEVLDNKDTDLKGAANFKEKQGWELPPSCPLNINPILNKEDLNGSDQDSGVAQQHAYEHLHKRTFIVPFPGQDAGLPAKDQQQSTTYKQYYTKNKLESNNAHYLFRLCLDWKVTKSAKI